MFSQASQIAVPRILGADDSVDLKKFQFDSLLTSQVHVLCAILWTYLTGTRRRPRRETWGRKSFTAASAAPSSVPRTSAEGSPTPSTTRTTAPAAGLSRRRRCPSTTRTIITFRRRRPGDRGPLN